MAAPLTPWAWVRRALAVAVLLMLAGWGVALLGCSPSPGSACSVVWSS